MRRQKKDFWKGYRLLKKQYNTYPKSFWSEIKKELACWLHEHSTAPCLYRNLVLVAIDTLTYDTITNTDQLFREILDLAQQYWDSQGFVPTPDCEFRASDVLFIVHTEQ